MSWRTASLMDLSFQVCVSDSESGPSGDGVADESGGMVEVVGSRGGKRGSIVEENLAQVDGLAWRIARVGGSRWRAGRSGVCNNAVPALVDAIVEALA